MSDPVITPGSLIAATAAMTPSQQAQMRANIGAVDTTMTISGDVKQAILNFFAHTAFVDDHGQTYYDALLAAFYPLDHITAVYTQSGTVYDTDSLDSLKTDLVVTAVYESGNTETVPAANYTLSGTLTVGTSTITVNYGGKTATFDVTVSTHVLYSLENRAFDTETINTQIALWETDQDWTIAFDANLTTNPTSGDGSAWRLVGAWSSAMNGWGIVFGKGNATATVLSFCYMGTDYVNVSNIAVGTGRYRFVFTHAKNSGSVTLKIRKDSGTAQTVSQSSAFQSISNTVRFGVNSTNYAHPKGTINKAYIYDTVLYNEQINTFLDL